MRLAQRAALVPPVQRDHQVCREPWEPRGQRAGQVAQVRRARWARPAQRVRPAARVRWEPRGSLALPGRIPAFPVRPGLRAKQGQQVRQGRVVRRHPFRGRLAQRVQPAARGHQARPALAYRGRGRGSSVPMPRMMVWSTTARRGSRTRRLRTRNRALILNGTCGSRRASPARQVHQVVLEQPGRPEPIPRCRDRLAQPVHPARKAMPDPLVQLGLRAHPARSGRPVPRDLRARPAASAQRVRQGRAVLRGQRGQPAAREAPEEQAAPALQV